MPSPLNTPTSESIPISIFDTVVDIELDEKHECHQMVGQRFGTSKAASFMSSKSPSSSTENFFSCLGSNDQSDCAFSLVTSASKSADLSSTYPTNDCDFSCSHFNNANNAAKPTTAPETDLCGVINGLKSNLTLAFNPQYRMQNEHSTANELNKSGSIRFRRARLQLQLPLTNPQLEVTTASETSEGNTGETITAKNGGQQCSAFSSSYGRQSVDSMDSTSSSVCSASTTGTTGTGSSLDHSTTSTESINSSSNSNYSNAKLQPPVSPCSGPKSAPIPLSLHTALTIDCGPSTCQDSQPIFARRKRPVFNFFLNQTINSIDSVRIDTSLALERQGWFHGTISRVDAEELLHKTKVGSYLVRKCDQRRQNYSVAIKSYKGFMHIRIYQNSETLRFTLGPTCTEYFNSIPELIDYFSLHRLPISGAEHMQLVFPVEAQLL